MTPSKLRELERIVRGFANHRRIEMLLLLRESPGLDLSQIARTLQINFKTSHEHARRLAIAGLLSKRAKGRRVLHQLTPLGQRVLSFLKTLQPMRESTSSAG